MPSHLHVHSDYSFLGSTARIAALIERAKALGITTLALTDSGNLFGAVPFYRAAKKAGIKPIIGCEVDVASGSRLDPADQESLGRMTLWAESDEGFRNLMQLVSDSHLRGKNANGKPRVDFASLQQFHRGLIASTGDQTSLVCDALFAGQPAEARAHVDRLKAVFGDRNVVVEVSNFGDARSKVLVPRLAALSEVSRLPLVATNDVRYLTQADAGLYDTVNCIATNQKKNSPFRPRAAHDQAFLKSPTEMAAAFRFLPRAIAGAEALADRCNVQMEFGKNLYPKFPLPEGVADVHAHLASEAQDGLRLRFDGTVPPEYQARLDHENAIIRKTGFSDYFLVVADAVKFAKRSGIPVGPGRGSGSGSLAAYALGITDIDPVKHGLFFERFLNEERVSPPDFDVDFCEHRRNEVTEHLREVYGKECTASIATFGTFATRETLRSLARVYSVGAEEIERVANTLPDEQGAPLTLRGAYETNSEFRREVTRTPEWRAIYAEGLALEGLIKNTGKHPAGLLISSEPLANIAAVADQKGDITVQLDKDSVEQMGLLKLDLLGLSTVSVINEAEQSIRTKNSDFDISKVATDDAKTFSMLRERRTAGVFQLGSSGMTAAVSKVGVNNFADLMAVIALYRPGPMQFIDQYADGKHNPQTIRPPHPLLAETTKDTNGILIYQEQVMDVAKKIAGFSLGEADILRKAMGKKDAELMQTMKAKFIAGAKARNVGEKDAGELFDTVEKFAGYGFNKAHSAGYAILAYRTAFLKANYPAHFMAASLSNKVGKPEEKAKLLGECRLIGLPVLPPDINSSAPGFTVTETKKGESIRFGLANIKGVGSAAADAIISERTKAGAFRGVQDLEKRLAGTVVNQGTIQTLIQAGAFDTLAPKRTALLEKYQKALGAPSSSGNEALWEKELLGQFVTTHPLDRFGGLPNALATHTASTLAVAKHRRTTVIVGAVSEVTTRQSARDNRAWATATIETADGPVRATVFQEAFAKTGGALKEGEVVVLRGSVEQDPQFGPRVQVRSVLDMTQATPSLIRHATLSVAPGAAGDALVDRCAKFGAASPGQTQFDVERGGAVIATHLVKLRLQAVEQMLSDPGAAHLELSAGAARTREVSTPTPIEQEIAIAESASVSTPSGPSRV
jgi:DNA polymerase III subunit alpha